MKSSKDHSISIFTPNHQVPNESLPKDPQCGYELLSKVAHRSQDSRPQAEALLSLTCQSPLPTISPNPSPNTYGPPRPKILPQGPRGEGPGGKRGSPRSRSQDGWKVTRRHICSYPQPLYVLVSHDYDKLPGMGYFIKKRGLFSLEAGCLRLGGSIGSASGEGLMVGVHTRGRDHMHR